MAELVDKKAPSTGSPKKVQKDIWMCVIVLSVLGLLSGVILGALNYVTYVDPEDIIKADISSQAGVAVEDVQKLDASLLVNKSGSKSFVKNCYYVDKDGKITYFYQSIGAESKGGTIELMVKVSSEGIIEDISKVSEKESPNYFNKVMKANKNKYVGADLKTIDGFVIVKGKDPVPGSNQIPNVSQATLSSRGFNNAVSAVAYEYNHRVGGAE